MSIFASWVVDQYYAVMAEGPSCMAEWMDWLLRDNVGGNENSPNKV